jgi:PIN domain nuclease of toxin-antitoxin system
VPGLLRTLKLFLKNDMKTFVLDTHTLVWFLADDRRLSNRVIAILEDEETRLVIPTIVLAEVKHLSYRGRFPQTLEDVLAVINANGRCTIYPADLQVVQNAPVGLDIHDSLIVGTALVQAVPVDGILTKDRSITASSTVPAVW